MATEQIQSADKDHEIGSKAQNKQVDLNLRLSTALPRSGHK